MTALMICRENPTRTSAKFLKIFSNIFEKFGDLKGEENNYEIPKVQN